jgi:hypothetical protein
VKYALMFVRNDDDFLGSPELDSTMQRIHRWFGELGPKVQGGAQLHPARNATTVRWSSGESMVTDGPFMESKETIAGFAIIEVADLDEAIAIARRWPAQDHAIELRPVVE